MPETIDPNSVVLSLGMAGVKIEAVYNPGVAENNTKITRYVKNVEVSSSPMKCATITDVFSQMQKKFFNG